MKGSKRKGRTVLLILFLAAVLIWLCGFSALFIAGKAVPVPGDTDAILVLGAQVLPDGTPNRILTTRLQKALEVYRERPQTIVCCGAQGSNEPACEGDVMRRWLIERGVPEADVLAETHSYNTYENIKNAKALLPDGVTNVLILTSDYHLPRAMCIARDYGFTPSGAGSDTYWLWRFKNHTREMLSWGKYLFRKVFSIQ